MKKRIISFFTALSMTLMLFTGIPIGVSAAVGDIEINATNFPDEKFREYINNNIDSDKNGILEADEIASTTEITITGSAVSNLKGIEYFTELTSFSPWNNPYLTTLDVSKNTKLEYLDCSSCSITELDVRQNTALTYLNCQGNNIPELDVSKNTALTHLECGFNAITKLDVSKNTALTHLGYTGKDNGILTELDVSQNTELTYLACSYNNLTGLDVSQNPKLTNLICFHNDNIAQLDISQNPELEILDCRYNKLTELDISNNKKLTSLSCGNNKLTELDVSNNDNLTTLGCGDNELTKLDISKNTKLTGLTCGNNKLTELDVSQNLDLTLLQCNNNQLALIDVSNNTKLGTGPRAFNCNNNKHTVSTCVLDKDTLPTGFDLSKASGWTNNVETTNDKILYKGTGDVTYTYDCGNGRTATFTLIFPSRDLTKVEAKDATYTEDGNIEYYECSCGYKFKNENPAAADILSDEDVVTAATGHTFSDEWTSSDTHHWHAATCGHTDEVSDKAVHSWDSGIVTTEPDEDTEGEKTYTCTICSATKTENIGKTEHKHTLTAHDAVPADCTTNGNEAYWTCSGCNKMFSDENGTTEITAIPTIPATGHKFA